MDMKLELVPVPVADIDRAVAFYRDRLGFVLDVDVSPAPGVRFVQLTPPGSACSISLSRGALGMDRMPPGSVHGVHLVVADIVRARAQLQEAGVDVSEIMEVGGGVRYAGITDPDGNTLLLQEMAWRTGEDF